MKKIILIFLISLFFSEEQIITLNGFEDVLYPNHFAFCVIPYNDSMIDIIQPLIDSEIFIVIKSGEDSLYYNDDGNLIDQIGQVEYFKPYTIYVSEHFNRSKTEFHGISRG